MRKKLVAITRCVGSVAVFAALLIASASAAAQTPGHFRGVVTAHTAAGRALRAQLHGAGAANSILGTATNMTYNGGPVMHTDANYSIYWEPSGYSTPASYKSIIDGYFTNVAGANGATSNDYSVATQYPDGSGAFSYGASFGWRILDTNPYPASGCSSGTGPCITDAQLQTELNNVISSHGLPRGTGNLYFVYFPSGVTTCFDSTGSQCSGNVYCAYHSSVGSGSSTTLYANMPYDGVSGCESGQYPNGDVAADSELNVTSHENIEAITDPLGNAWYDLTGQEIGDKCNFNFGSPLGGAAGSEYNESISSGHYWLQQEWSNAASGCVQRS
ncbi:MAG: hypothetical protein WCB67_01685 [Solirubrobacteraceae bacterium]